MGGNKCPDGGMSVGEAVEVLNSSKHHGHSGWYLSGMKGSQIVLGVDQYEFFEEFETIAIAEKYNRVRKSSLDFGVRQEPKEIECK